MPRGADSPGIEYIWLPSSSKEDSEYVKHKLDRTKLAECLGYEVVGDSSDFGTVSESGADAENQDSDIPGKVQAGPSTADKDDILSQ